MKYTPYAEFSLARRRVRVAAGGLIGRATQATLRLAHPSVSEAHALLTFRAGELRLQALRGQIRIDREPLQEIVLTEGTPIRLSEAVTITVEKISIPDTSLALVVAGKISVIPRLPCSLIGAEDVGNWSSDLRIDSYAVIHEQVASALLVLYEDDRGLWCVVPPEPPQPVSLPAEWRIGERSFRLISVPLNDTPVTSGGARKIPLRISVRFDSVHIWVGTSHKPELLSGKAARVVSEIVALGKGPVRWDIVAREVWDRYEDRLVLRGRWDKTIQGLRREFRTRGIREDLIRTDRHGNVELVLYAEDLVEDGT